MSQVDPQRKSAVSEEAEPWSLTTLREKLIRIGARMVRHGRYVTFQMAEVAVPTVLAHVVLDKLIEVDGHGRDVMLRSSS